MDLEHEKRLTEVEARAKSNTRRLDELKPIVDEIRKMSEALVAMTSEVKHTNKDVGEIKSKVEALEEKPAKRWDTVITVMITAIVSGLITYALTAIF